MSLQTKDRKRIFLGIDPGTTRIGFGLVTIEEGNVKYIDSGLLNLEKVDEHLRVLHAFNGITELIKKNDPDEVGIEKVFFAKNKKTALAVSETRGAIVTAVLARNKVVRHFTPLQVKQAVSTYGTASKQEVGKMVGLLLGLKEIPKIDDVTDALAVAICCANRSYERSID